MNSLVATPPVPPHFYENPRFSPSRMSKTSLSNILFSGLGREANKDASVYTVVVVFEP
jgi:protein Cut8